MTPTHIMSFADTYDTVDDERLLDVIFEAVHYAVHDRDGFDGLPDVLRNIWLAARIDGEVGNGGFSQLFWNLRSRPEVHVSAMEAAIRAVGAKKAATLLTNAYAELTKRKPVYTKFMTDSYWDGSPALLRRIDAHADEWYKLRTSVRRRICAYVGKHRNDPDVVLLLEGIPFRRRPEPPQPKEVPRATDVAIAASERDSIERLLRRNGGSVGQAAEQADINEKSFRRLMKKHGIGESQPS